MGTTLLTPDVQMVNLSYYLNDSEGNEWEIRVVGKVNIGSKDEKDEAGISYPGNSPEVHSVTMAWFKADGTFQSEVHPAFCPPSMLDRIEERLIILANEQSENS